MSRKEAGMSQQGPVANEGNESYEGTEPTKSYIRVFLQFQPSTLQNYWPMDGYLW